jgi:hypothetical protein
MPGAGTKTGITTDKARLAEQPPLVRLAQAYRMRWKRRRYLWRAFRARHGLRLINGPKRLGSRHGIYLFCTIRNEAERLPYFLDHYRQLGVSQFFFVENASVDNSLAYLLDQPDCAVWQVEGSYKAARFGMDWQNHLLRRYGHDCWCLTVDADEFLVYPGMNRVDLKGLTNWLDQERRKAFGTLMLDMYPSGAVNKVSYHPGDNPFEQLCWFDAGPYRAARQPLLRNLWVQGGARERVFFADTPSRSPTLNKIPLVKWNKRNAYVNSTHSMLPRDLNGAYISMDGELEPSGALLHAKFLPSAMAKSADPSHKREHFSNSAEFDAYFEAVASNPTLWSPNSVKYRDPEQLADLGLIAAGSWIDKL